MGIRLRRIALGVLVVATMVSAGRAIAVARQQPVIAQALTEYINWLSDGTGSPRFPPLDLDDARERLDDLASAFIHPKSKTERQRLTVDRRRQLLTAFALELAAAGSRRQAAAAGRLVEWACAHERSHAAVDAFDRAWQLAALAVLEGGINPRVLQQHLDHAGAFAGEGSRMALARAVVDEQALAPVEALTPQSIQAATGPGGGAAAAEGERRRAAARAIDRFTEAAGEAGLRGEAILRLGHVQLVLGRYDDALAAWTTLDAHTGDPALRYLVELFRGLALEGRGEDVQAEAAYRRALAISPGAHSATMRLAVLLFRTGHSDEANNLMAALLRDDDARRDPWWSYYAADWRLWYAHVERLRAVLRSPEPERSAGR